MQSREGMPLGRVRCSSSYDSRCLAQRWMAVGPSQPQMMPQTAMTAISTNRCLRLRMCRGSESDSKYDPMEPTSTNLATRGFLGSVGVRCRAELRHAATQAGRPEPRYRTEVRRARLPRPHSYARWPCP